MNPKPSFRINLQRADAGVNGINRGDDDLIAKAAKSLAKTRSIEVKANAREEASRRRANSRLRASSSAIKHRRPARSRSRDCRRQSSLRYSSGNSGEAKPASRRSKSLLRTRKSRSRSVSRVRFEEGENFQKYRELFSNEATVVIDKSSQPSTSIPSSGRVGRSETRHSTAASHPSRHSSIRASASNPKHTQEIAQQGIRNDNAKAQKDTSRQKQKRRERGRNTMRRHSSASIQSPALRSVRSESRSRQGSLASSLTSKSSHESHQKSEKQVRPSALIRASLKSEQVNHNPPICFDSSGSGTSSSKSSSSSQKGKSDVSEEKYFPPIPVRRQDSGFSKGSRDSQEKSSEDRSINSPKSIMPSIPMRRTASLKSDSSHERQGASSCMTLTQASPKSDSLKCNPSKQPTSSVDGNKSFPSVGGSTASKQGKRNLQEETTLVFSRKPNESSTHTVAKTMASSSLDKQGSSHQEVSIEAPTFQVTSEGECTDKRGPIIRRKSIDIAPIQGILRRPGKSTPLYGRKPAQDMSKSLNSKSTKIDRSHSSSCKHWSNGDATTRGGCIRRARAPRGMPRNMSMPALSSYAADSVSGVLLASSSLQGGASTVNENVATDFFLAQFREMSDKTSGDDTGGVDCKLNPSRDGETNSHSTFYSAKEDKEERPGPVYSAYSAREVKAASDVEAELDSDEYCFLSDDEDNNRFAMPITQSASDGREFRSQHSSLMQSRRPSTTSHHSSFDSLEDSSLPLKSSSFFNESTVALRDESQGWGLHFDGDDLNVPLGKTLMPVDHVSFSHLQYTTKLKTQSKSVCTLGQHSSNTSRTSSTISNSSSEYYQDILDDVNKDVSVASYGEISVSQLTLAATSATDATMVAENVGT